MTGAPYRAGCSQLPLCNNRLLQPAPPTPRCSSPAHTCFQVPFACWPRPMLEHSPSQVSPRNRCPRNSTLHASPTAKPLACPTLHKTPLSAAAVTRQVTGWARLNAKSPPTWFSLLWYWRATPCKGGWAQDRQQPDLLYQRPHCRVPWEQGACARRPKDGDILSLCAAALRMVYAAPTSCCLHVGRSTPESCAGRQLAAGGVLHSEYGTAPAASMHSHSRPPMQPTTLHATRLQ
jgi:hypothetical protein